MTKIDIYSGFLGAGKTTLIKKLAARYRSEGKTVLVTTTTHMFIEEEIGRAHV